MHIVNSFGKNIYIEDRQVGYIGRNGMFINGHKFADLTEDGDISFGEKVIGYVDEDGYIIINDAEVGYIDLENNFVFYKTTVFNK
ncbi:MAG: hypothetical protein MJZ37_01705 [Bacilli bacterium]|nr:hypothetical protein [Bacilli bacterium]